VGWNSIIADRKKNEFYYGSQGMKPGYYSENQAVLVPIISLLLNDILKA
jgi:hypothetical protein